MLNIFENPEKLNNFSFTEEITCWKNCGALIKPTIGYSLKIGGLNSLALPQIKIFAYSKLKKYFLKYDTFKKI